MTLIYIRGFLIATQICLIKAKLKAIMSNIDIKHITQISEDKQVITLINVFTVEPQNQHFFRPNTLSLRNLLIEKKSSNTTHRLKPIFGIWQAYAEGCMYTINQVDSIIQGCTNVETTRPQTQFIKFSGHFMYYICVRIFLRIFWGKLKTPCPKIVNVIKGLY